MFSLITCKRDTTLGFLFFFNFIFIRADILMWKVTCKLKEIKFPNIWNRHLLRAHKVSAIKLTYKPAGNRTQYTLVGQVNQQWQQSKGAFIVYCNAAAVPMYRLLIYRSSTQRTASHVHFRAVPQCSSRCRDGSTTTATYRNADAVDYERSFIPYMLHDYSITGTIQSK